jgi:hypothetical protein
VTLYFNSICGTVNLVSGFRKRSLFIIILILSVCTPLPGPSVPLLPSPWSELLEGVPPPPNEAPFTPYLVSVTGRLRNREGARSHVF